MKIKRGIFILSILAISFLCLGFMNTRYNALSRYPYNDEKANELIKENLNKDEIEYLIEYSIAPSTFVDYIDKPMFNVYHIEYYNEMYRFNWTLDPAMIVRMVEETWGMIDITTLERLLVHYKYDEITYYLKFGDSYNTDAYLLQNAGDLYAYVDDNATISTRVPFNLLDLAQSIPTKDDKVIQIDKAAYEPMINLCQAIETDLQNGEPCGGLVVEDGYVSYNEQIIKYEAAIEKYGQEKAIMYESYPGHSDNQLGFCVDFEVSNDVPFEQSEQGIWLMNNAYHYGFIQPYNESTVNETNKLPKYNHIRYVGVNLATYMHDKNVTFKQVLNIQ